MDIDKVQDSNIQVFYYVFADHEIICTFQKKMVVLTYMAIQITD